MNKPLAIGTILGTLTVLLFAQSVNQTHTVDNQIVKSRFAVSNATDGLVFQVDKDGLVVTPTNGSAGSTFFNFVDLTNAELRANGATAGTGNYGSATKTVTIALSKGVPTNVTENTITPAGIGAMPIAGGTFLGPVTVPTLTVSSGLTTPLLQANSLVFSNAFKGNQVTLAYDGTGTNMVIDLNAGNQFWATLTGHTMFYITNWSTVSSTNYDPVILHVWEDATGGRRALFCSTNFDFRGYSSELNNTNANARNSYVFYAGAALTNLVFVAPPALPIPAMAATNNAGTAVLTLLGAEKGATLTSLTLGNGRLHAYPFRSGAGGLITNLSIHVVTGAAAGGVARVGIYDNKNANVPYPGNLLVDGGELATTNTASDLNFPVSIRLLPNQIYFASIFVGTNNPVVYNGNALAMDNCWGYAYSTANPYTYLYSSITYGAMPSTFGTTSLTWINNGTGAPVVFAQFAQSP